MKNKGNIGRRSMSKRLSVLVASTIVVTQIASITTPTFANNLTNIEEAQNQVLQQERINPISEEIYTALFDDTEKCDWKTLIGEGTHEVENGYLKVTRNAQVNNEFTFFDQNAPQLKDSEAEMVFKLDGDASRGVGRFGFILRPQTDGAYLFAGYDLNGNWRIATANGSSKDFSGPKLNPGEEYKLKVRFEGKKITMWLNDEQIFSEEVNLQGMPLNSSYGVGFKTWYGLNDAYVDYFRAGTVGALDEKMPLKPIKSVEEVTAETFIRIRPELPKKVNVTYEDGTTALEGVEWDYIDKTLYSKEGIFKSEGTLVDREDRVTATVTVKADPEDGTIIPPEVVVEEKVIQSGDMKVVLDNNFPRVIRYEVGGDVLEGEDEQLFIVELNEEKYVPKVAYNTIDEKTAEYVMTFEELDLIMKVQISLVKDDALKMEVKEIVENGSFKLRTINFPGHSLASVKSTENGKISGVLTTGDWNNIQEKFENVSDVKMGDYNKTYGIINDDKFAIAVDNNVIEGGNRIVINVADRNGYKKAGIYNGTWTYREAIKSSSAPAFIGNIGNVEINGNTNQPIFSSEEKIKKYMGKEYEAVYCGLGGVEDFQGKDLTGKVAIVDRGTHTFEDKARNAQAAGALYIICINTQSGGVPEQGTKDTINMIGLSNEYGEKIKATLDGNGVTKVKLNLEDSGAVPGEPEELPWSQIMIAKDKNKSGKVNWQDAAILYRDNMDEVKGADYIKNSFSYIPFNIGSLAQSPFLRTGDMIKKLSNYTDGFGQLVLEKGYQGEGHDDVIADIGGHTGIRQGGKDDLNKLIEIGKDYNAKIGVHVNATEYHLDAFELDVNNLRPGFQEGWAWKDNSYYVDQKKDILTGELKRRFSMLKEDHPDLSWIYVDVYTGNGWNANELSEIIKDNDWMLATEFNGPLEQQTAWTHWGGDPAYPNRGNESKMIRFIRNQEQDVFMSDDLLKGAKHALSGGWGTRHDVEGFYAIETFYNQTLPSKYMQHFEIMEWEDDGTNGFVKFNDGLEVKRENGNINMYQDGKLISITPKDTINDRGIGKTTLFMPWTWEQLDNEPENKVYHWNPEGGTTTWDIPTGWEGTETVKIYELSDLGRTFVDELPVTNGKVTIEAKANTPYIVFQEKVNEDRINNWGEGTLISDPGFDSQTLDSWTINSSSENKEHISIINENVDRRLGNDAVVVQGNNGADANLSQKITGLEPGKTYTASVWVKNYGDRDVTLGFKSGCTLEESTITRETTRMNVGEGLKWHGERATRMRVEFTIPEGITEGTLYLNVAKDEDDSKVLIDDFRIWTNPLDLDKTNRDGYVIYEDFENVDEGHGPLYMGQNLGTDNRTHYAEKDPEGKQYMNWVIDGRFSLKSNQQPGTTGEILLTDESTLKLKPNTTYEIGFKYTNKIDNLYSVAIKSETSGELFNENLTPGTVTGRPIDGPEYKREVKEFKKEFTTGNAVDYYLAFNKGNGYDELVLDDLYIKDVTPEDKLTLESVRLCMDNTTLIEGNESKVVLEAIMSNGNKADLSKATIKYTVSNPEVLSVEDGVIKTKKEGVSKVSAEVTINGSTVASNEIEVTVKKKSSVINKIPVINAKDSTIELNSKFDPMTGVTAEDAEEGNLTDKIKVVENTVNTAKAGKYKVIYEVVDSEGAKATKKIKVTVKEKQNTTNPSKPSDSSNSGNKGNLPQTGGVNSLLVLLSGIAAVGAGTFLKRRKNKL
ncbi:endo-alpha-N-acetylgalactosaminidase family protein [Clostridium chauvoei]|uniref:endo-alpha-N-acetylgalactosaminidase family protein n=1 Tax=Clostridium chauvoei TaxID=46867 RepID=UPI001C84DD58|nr:endo-alpha-N-acetylgalactosaminidase family protein [Clostridium chauvoei]MBX7286356.1 DUF5011 domain-containing protein [Clostridium chauvoei]MBX7293848.1 DUF5011 domain-containing protein [Clostridium chauvoei]MBX7298843.1 DUF5011 domain-containing protein [Clostridium chauvoei]MBX7319027.1 DUF5011 domain-containing protein [Clostridium chauvoei]MBX7321516.1 DUF5011 domain-containing protein [Clostridium chauvoei]